ncbi:MAG: glycosyltransferase family 4 protein [Acidobacteria bacterium]|nr:glycosyltransferase family 4 protein [Acidobacteriota bacterium]
MRICMVTHSLYESDSRVMRYAEALAARGDEVEVIALRKEGKPEEEVIAGVRVLRIHPRSFQEKTKLSFLKQVAAFFAKTAWVLSKRHARKPYDLLHIHSIPDFIVFVALLPKLMGAKIILDIHDILPELYASKFHVSEQSLGFKIMLFLEKVSIDFSDHIIIANHIWQDRLLARSLTSDRCTVMLNYPDRSAFYPQPRTRTTDEFVMLYPGTLNKHQGLDVAIRAFALIKDQAPQAMFWIHGEGRTQDALIQLVAQLGLQDRILFKPMLPIREVGAVMANADLAVVPKRKDSFGNEAFSTKIFEFMSVGVPVVVSDTKIDKYYFNDSVVRFFKDGDEKDLAEAMLFMINHPEARMQQARNAAEFVRTYDWDVNKSTYLSLVDSLLPEKKAGRGQSERPRPENEKASAQAGSSV